MLTRLGRACYRRRWLVLVGWAGVLAGLMSLSSAYGGEFVNDFTLPGSESQVAQEVLEAHAFPPQAGEAGQVVFGAADVNDRAVHDGVRSLFAELDRALAPVDIISPFTDAGEHFVSDDDTIAFAIIHRGARSEDRYDAAAARARALVEQADVPGTRVELGGSVFAEPPDFSSETYGFLAAMIVLLIALGSLLAMGLPR